MIEYLLGAGAVSAAGAAVYQMWAPRGQWYGRTFTGLEPGSKQLALTYDDGPNEPHTLRLLEVLAKHDVHATFFMIGRYVERRTDIAREVARAGHAIGNHTVDEYGVLFRNLFSMDSIEVAQIQGIVISSVVPPLDSTLRQVSERDFHTKPLFIEPGVKTGMPVLYDNPAEVGADRIVNSVAAFEKYGGPCISVDFGTATTFDCVSAKGEYIGGVICPGIGISAEALFGRTARLQRVDIRKPARIIGTNTVTSMQSGLYYGYLGLVDGILSLLLPEMGENCRVVATGGLSALFGSGSKYIKTVDDLLTLDGLRIIWERNQASKPHQATEAERAQLSPKISAHRPSRPSKPWPGAKRRR